MPGLISDAIILAGGLGTRLRPIVNDVPKPMAPVNGKPFLEYLLIYLRQQGIRRVVLSTGYRWEQIFQYFQYDYGGMVLEYAVEEQPLGTGGGLLLALDKAGSEKDVLVLNGDTWFPVEVERMFRFHMQMRADCTIAVLKKMGARFGCVTMTDSNRIASFNDAVSCGEMPYINGGVYIIKPDAMRKLYNQETGYFSLEQGFFKEFSSTGAQFFGHPCDREFYDIGTPEDYLLFSAYAAGGFGEKFKNSI